MVDNDTFSGMGAESETSVWLQKNKVTFLAHCSCYLYMLHVEMTPTIDYEVKLSLWPGKYAGGFS